MPEEPIISARGLHRSFPDDRGVRDLDLEVPEGTIFGLVGPSGSGKTTVVRLLVGLDQPDEGDLTVFGRRPTGFSGEDRRRIGYLPQSSALYPELSLRHNLDIVASLYGMPWRMRIWPGSSGRQRIEEALEFVDLTDRQRTRLGDASGGEKRRLGLAAAVVHEPDLLILDEPTSAVDPVLRRRIWERLRSLRDEGRTVFVTTQYVQEATNCDLVALIINGRELVVDTPDALRGIAFGEGQFDEATTFDDVFVELVTREHSSGDGSGGGG